MDFAVHRGEPSSAAIRAFLDGVCTRVGHRPRHLISDQGIQLTAKGFQRWCRRREMQPRFGAVEKCGSPVVVERCIRTLKAECTRRLMLVPFRLATSDRELALYFSWHDDPRPHTQLAGATPGEVCHGWLMARRFCLNCPETCCPVVDS